jgi:ubiquinone biosynthesis monooxygenase Coq7
VSLVDQLIIGFDKALRTSTGNTTGSNRPSPAREISADNLTSDERELAARLMRVNHCGEVCAQALYHGQALTAKSGRVANAMLKAAEEETDHLVWCEGRLKELDASISKLNPVWYASSYAMGALTGLLGDKVNLGFVAATEEQVCKHLDEHLEKLPEQDNRSRSILEAMREDEKHHEETALAKGGARFPDPVKSVMTGFSSLMTRSTYWI